MDFGVFCPFSISWKAIWPIGDNGNFTHTFGGSTDAEGFAFAYGILPCANAFLVVAQAYNVAAPQLSLVASYLALDLALDWRAGAAHFEETLLDHDVASNWGNWASAAGVTGGRINRFNIVKQSKDYDADGSYVRHWLPELSELPSNKIHEPWTLSKDEQKKYGLTLGVDYPLPPKSQWAGFPDGGGG